MPRPARREGRRAGASGRLACLRSDRGLARGCVAVDEGEERLEVRGEELDGLLVGDLAVLGEQAGGRLHVALRLTERGSVEVAEDGLEVLLRRCGGDAAARGADDGGRLAVERALAPR